MTAALLCLLTLTSYTPPGPVQVRATDGLATAQGPDFLLTWDARRGGQITSLHARDWAGLRELAAGSLGDLVADGDGGPWRLSLSHAPADWRVEDLGEGRYRLSCAGERPLRDESGRPGPLLAQQSFTVFAEGALFCDLGLRFRPGAGDTSLPSVALEFPCATAQLQPFGFYAKGPEHTGPDTEYLPRDRALDTTSLITHAGFMYGRTRGFCAAAEFLLEDQTPLVNDAPLRFQVTPESDGRKTFRWLLYDGPAVPLGDTPLGDGVHLRWGLCVSRTRQRSVAIGQRVAHWQEGRANLMSFPSDSAVEALALAGVTVNVLHLYWCSSWGRNHVPVDRPALDRWVAACRRHGVRPVLYVVPVDKPGLDGLNNEWYDDYGVEGLYFDFGAVAFNLPRYEPAYPALQFLELTRHYREVVGPRGLMISHVSNAFPDLVFLRNVDAYLPGEVGHHSSMLSSWEAACWHGGLATAVSHPWCEYGDWQTKRATAVFAAVGAFPHVLFGRGTHQDNNYHRCILTPAAFVLPYWQMLRTISMDENTVLYNEATRPVARLSAPGAHWVVYSRGPDLALVIVSNLGDSADVKLTLDAGALALDGRYLAWRLFDDVTRHPHRDRWSPPAVDLGRMDTDEYTAVVIAREGTPAEAEVSERLAAIAELRRQLTCHEPPGAVSDLQAHARQGSVRLEWTPAPSSAHIREYRVSRSDIPSGPVAAAEECTSYVDLTATPGSRVSYEVRAVDVAGNVGPPAAVEVSVPAAGLLTADFAQSLGPLISLTGDWVPGDGWLLGGASFPIAMPEGDEFTFEPVLARHVRLSFSGGRYNFGNAHVIEAAVFDPDGRPVHPAGVRTSGADPGHPEAHITDGIRDQARNGWWSDRTRGLPAWVVLDLPQAQRLARVRVQTYADGKRWYDYRVEVSDDGQAWREVARSPRPPAVSIALGPEVPEQLTVSVVLRQTETYRVPGGLLFAANDAGDGYLLLLDDNWDGALQLARLADGKIKTLKTVPFGHSIHRPIPHLLEVRLRRRTAECWCDGLHVYDVDLHDLPGRRVGLACAGGRLLFDNLQVARLTDPR